MSGDPPNGFEKHSSDNGTDAAPNAGFYNEIDEWLGRNGLLDMRAYLRFKFLDYVKDKVLPDKPTKSAVSNVEIAINMLVIDFVLRQQYYFTLCLLSAEIQAFSKLDKKLTPLLTRLSKVTTEDLENLTPLLDPDQVCMILRTFKIDPTSVRGQSILHAYTSKGMRFSLIQLALSGSHRKPDNSKVRRKSTAVASEMCNLKRKFSEIIGSVEAVRNSVVLLVDLVNSLLVHEEQTFQRCIPYAKLTMKMQRQLVKLNMSMAKMRNVLRAREKKIRTYSIKRIRVKANTVRHISNSTVKTQTVNCFTDNTTQTEPLSEPDSTKGPLRIGSATQTNPDIIMNGEKIDEAEFGQAEREESILASDLEADKGENLVTMLLNRDDARAFDCRRIPAGPAPNPSSLAVKDVVAIVHEKYELQKKIVEQNRRITFLTLQICKLSETLAEENVKCLRTQPLPVELCRDNIAKTESTGDNRNISNSSTRRMKSAMNTGAHRMESTLAALASVKAEISLLRGERKHLEEMFQSPYGLGETRKTLCPMDTEK